MQPMYEVRLLSSKGVIIYLYLTYGTKISSLTLRSEKSIGIFFSLRTTTILILATNPCAKGQKILSGQHSNKDKHFDLYLDHVNGRSIGNIYSLHATTVPSLSTLKQRGRNVLSGQHLYKNQQFHLDLRPCDLQ